MDFFNIRMRPTKRGSMLEVYPDFVVKRSKDIMVRGKSFYAIWDEEKGLWSTNEYDVPRLVDKELYDYAQKQIVDSPYKVLALSDFSSNSWTQFKKYIGLLSDSSIQLDSKLTFQNSVVKKTDYVSKRLPYSLGVGDYFAWDKIVGTLYNPKERRKIEWAIGSIISGDSCKIQKFLVLYGEAGAGKSTILNIIQKLFEGYYTAFNAKELVSNSNSFGTEVFKSNPLVAIQHDGDLSRIEDNSKMNSIISHEDMVLNEKYKPSYITRINCFLFMATNRPVKITDAKSGIIRRLIDVAPSGRKIPFDEYNELMDKIDFELGAIAQHCLDVYKTYGKKYYDSYRPVSMMYKTDPVFNFLEDSYDYILEQKFITLKTLYSRYKQYCENYGGYELQMYKFREEMKNYFDEFIPQYVDDDGKHYRSVFKDFKTDRFNDDDNIMLLVEEETIGKNNKTVKTEFSCPKWLVLNNEASLIDIDLADCKAQYATNTGVPTKKWCNANTCLKDLDTSQLHYVMVPDNHIVIDFDIKDPETGDKSLELNLEAASKWPKTYAEYSKSGKGLHLHYIYDGDVSRLNRIYDDNIEIKVFTGNSSLRRRVTKCNDIPVAMISSGLPLREEKPKVMNFEVVKNEKTLRSMIKNNLRKEYHNNTKPSIDFIKTLLDEAYESGTHYDVRDLRRSIQAFARKSTNQSQYCMKMVTQMHFCSDDISEDGSKNDNNRYDNDDLIFYDVEVYPNLFLIVWKAEGDHEPVKMINPTPSEVEELTHFKLIGFNCRRYDNHILYGRIMGYNNEQLYDLSQRIISGKNHDCFFGEAYNISYTDVYDFASAGHKKSLKKFEIELGIHHQEMGLRWDQPVDESLWCDVADYCVNDVIATEAVFHHLSLDWTARQILAELSGLTVNDTTNSHTTRIIFGNTRHPELVYTNLKTGEHTNEASNETPDVINAFPDYDYADGKNMFRGEDVGRGGYVYAKPGMYFGHIVTFDVASMHPHSIFAMNCFGDYTPRFKELLDARICIKHKDFETARTMMDGKLAPYLTDEKQAKGLSEALKTAINSVYGLTSAKFNNPFRDSRNENNIVALRGALFMMTLRDEVVNKGFEVIHIKTDSIKVVDPSDELSEFIFDFAKKYGYTFEIEHIFDRICLVNDSVYIAKLDKDDPDNPGKWIAVGTQFQQPYVFKKLFSKEDITFKDYCETKTVTSALYLDMNEGLPDVTPYETELSRREFNNKIDIKHGDPKKKKKLNPEYQDITNEELCRLIAEGHSYHFVGKAGSFTPVKSGCGGGILVRDQDGKYNSANGAKGYRWLESEIAEKRDDRDAIIDKRYAEELANSAIDNISKYGDFEVFISNERMDLPWV